MDAFVARSAPRLLATAALLGALAVAALLAQGCGGAKNAQAVTLAGDGGVTDSPDAGLPDAGTPDAGAPDAGSPDGGAPDAGAPDAGPTFGGPGPWPVENRSYGSADGIDESPVVAMSTDEAQNRWVATPNALFLLRPGDKAFTKFTSRDGLHLADNPVMYPIYECGGDGKTLVAGAADPRGIDTIVGGKAGEVFVGYWGADEMTGGCADPAWARHSGKVDRVHLLADGTLQVDRFDLASVHFGLQFWHNRTVLRMVYDHQLHPHTLYVATNHGVDMIYPDHYRAPNPGEWPDNAFVEWMADHLHVAPCQPGPCPLVGEGNQMIGWWLGLAVAPDGDLWHAGRFAAGKIRWVQDLQSWEMRGGTAAFAEAFGDPYPGNPPVFFPPTEGDVVSIKAVAVQDDGTAWFGSGTVFGKEIHYGIASFLHGKGFTYYQPGDVGMAETDVQDIAALPDGRLVFAGPSTGIVFYDPVTKKSVALRAGQGIPDDHVIQLEVDRLVDPPELHVSTAGGAAVIRVFPK